MQVRYTHSLEIEQKYAYTKQRKSNAKGGRRWGCICCRFKNAAARFKTAVRCALVRRTLIWVIARTAVGWTGSVVFSCLTDEVTTELKSTLSILLRAASL